MNAHFRNFAVWIIILLLVVALFNLVGNNAGRHGRTDEIDYSKFLAEVENRNVKSVTISGNVLTGQEITGKYNNENEFVTLAPNDPQLVERLRSKDVAIQGKRADDNVPSLLSILVTWLDRKSVV